MAVNFRRSISSCLVEENDRNLSEALMKTGHDITRTEDSVSPNTSKCRFNSKENVSGFVKETETASLVVQEMFVGSNEVSLCEFNQTQNSSEESEHVFRFKFPLNININISQASDGIRSSGFEAMDRVGNGLLNDHDFSYEADSNRIISHVSASDESNRVFDHREKSRDIEEDNRIELEETSYYITDSDDDDDDEDETDVLREHQNLVQQMKMELKNCRVKGLPTISEEHESPKTLDDLKHFEIERKFEYKDAVDEIRRFYKIYAEKMRKLDILNYQTLQAISFLEMKDRQVLTPRNKKSGSTRTKLCDTRKIYADPSHNKSTPETSRDLELIYVGQVCLSWEMLAWSYMKAQELQKHDSKGNHSYNRVSEEFQQFQVLLNRFIEDEPFQGGGERTTSYVRRRCAIRNLLQVPMIKEDCYKDKRGRTEETDSISLEILLGVIRESMVVFQDFLCADKRAVNTVVKVVRGNKADDDKEYSNSRLLADIVGDLYKKEKRIKESIRSQSCVLKKLKKQQQCKSDEVFKSQVDLRLVSRVLRLPKLTKDQMLWCQMKLNNIGFVSAEIVSVEPSFLLLPC